MDNNRIGSRCWYLAANQRIGKEIIPIWLGGTLRAWSTDHEEFETGPGLVPVGVVEDEETMRCHSVHVDNISFAAIPPK